MVCRAWVCARVRRAEGMSRIAIIAALPGELKRLVDTGWKKHPSRQKHVTKWTARYGDTECIAVCAGMGADAATRAFASAEEEGHLDEVLSIGWAGALTPKLRSGDFCIPSTVIDALTGEHFQLSENSRRQNVLVTTERVVDAQEKKRLAETYGGNLVDMESATVARLAQMRGIPVCCMKYITDEANVELPDINPFIDYRGQMKMLRFVGHVAARPHYWSSLVRLGKTSKKGSEYLASAILNFLSNPERDISAVNEAGFIPDWQGSEWKR